MIRYDVAKVMEEDAKLSGDEWRERIRKLINSADTCITLDELDVGRDRPRDDWYQLVRELLSRIASKAITCTSCRVHPLYMVPSKKGKMMPFTKRGISHFADCPGADRHRAGAAGKQGRIA